MVPTTISVQDKPATPKGSSYLLSFSQDNLPYAPNLREAVYGVPLLPMDNPAQSFGTHTIDLRGALGAVSTSRVVIKQRGGRAVDSVP